jgi:hypothetical protein
MGASQSIDAATEKQLKEVGPFVLRSSEKGAISVLSQIFQKLITENNLFDLRSLLSSPEKCSDLFIIVSTTVKKEFQLLKFPDPRNPSHMATMSFLQKGKYPPTYPDSVAARDRACNEITHFLIRLITLAAACTASISRNENIATGFPESIMGRTNTTDTLRLINELPSNLTFTTQPVSEDALNFLSSIFKQIDPENRPNLYRYGNTVTYMIDAKKGVIYNARESTTPVFQIKMEMITAKNKLGEFAGQPMLGYAGLGAQGAPYAGLGAQGVQGAPYAGLGAQGAPYAAQGAPYAAQGAPYAAQGAQAAPKPPSDTGTEASYNAQSNTTSNVRSSGLSQLGVRSGGRKTRRHRASRYATRRRRMQRMQRGGEDTVYVKCTVEEIPFAEFRECESPSQCKKTEFVIDATGTMYDYDAYVTFQGNPTREIPMEARKEFGLRMESLFNTIMRNKIPTVPYKERTELSKDRYKAIEGASDETLNAFEDYHATMKELPTGSAPAPYRGFLLASRYAGNELSTYFCKDVWADQYVTATLAYSLLQALYDDGFAGGTPSPRSLDACKSMAKQFTGAQVAIPASQTGSDVENFRNIRFAPIPSALDSYCKTAAPQTTSLADDKRVLIGAQQELRKLYNAHIGAMVGIMKKVMFITTDPSRPGSMLFNLNERFMNDPAGGLAALEAIIGEARTLIGNHYFAVEKQYAGALLQVGRHRRGVTAVNNPEIASSVLNKVNAKLGP